MRLPRAVLDVVRGAGGAAVVLALGCSSSPGAPIRGEPAARLAPIATAVSAPATRPSVVAPPAVPVASPLVATLEPVPAAPPPPTDTPDAGVRRRHRHRVDPGLGTIDPFGGGIAPDPMVMANCGRG